MDDAVPLSGLASIIRSKNAGPFRITLDIVFPDWSTYVRIKRSGLINPALVSSLYRLEPGQLTDFVEFDPACAIKATFKRSVSSGSAGDSDVYGAQQHAPLLNILIPAEVLRDSGDSELDSDDSSR